MVSLGRTPCQETVGDAKAVPCSKASQPWVLAATILGSSMAFIDGSLVNVANPVIQKALSASVTQMEWVSNAYLLSLSALALLGGAIGDRIGRKLIFIVGIALFTASSVGCAFSPSPLVLISARAVQGIGAALLVPTSLAILGATFSDEDRGKAIGTWAGASAIVTAFAPVLGGWLVDFASWRTIFWINVPVAAGAIFLSVRHMPETQDSEAKGRLDFAGAALIALSLGGIAYGLSPDPWHQEAFAVGVILLIAFAVLEGKIKNPLVPLTLFRNHAFTGANLLTLFLYFALSGAFFFIPFYLIQVQGFSATSAGASLLPFTFVMGIFSRWSGGLVKKYGARRPLIVGPLIAAAGLVLCSMVSKTSTYWTGLFPGILVIGVGITISVAPLTTTIVSSVGESKVGLASGINNTVARVAGLLAVSILGFVVLRLFSEDLLAWVHSHPGPAGHSIEGQLGQLAAMKLPPNLSPIDHQSAVAAIADAMTNALRVALLSCAALCVLASGCSLALIDNLRPSAPRT